MNRVAAKKSRLHRPPAGVVLLMLGALAFAPFAQGSLGSGDIVYAFPDERLLNAAALRSFLDERAGFSADLMLGLDPVAAREFVVRDDGSLELFVTWGNGSATSLIQSTSGKLGSASWTVAPHQLPRVAEVGWDASAVRFYGAPGAIDLGERAPERQARALAEALGLPISASAAWDSREELLRIKILGEITRLDRPGLYLECACMVLELRDRGFAANLHRITVAFSEGHPVYVEVAAWVDLAASRVLDHAQAEEALRAALEERGYRAKTLTYAWTELRPAEERLVYTFDATLYHPNRDEWFAAKPSQDARTGELLHVAGVMGESPTHWRLIPDLAFVSTVLAVLFGAAASWRVRRPPRGGGA